MTIHAQLPKLESNQQLIILSPIKLNNGNKFIGWKINTLKYDESNKNNLTENNTNSNGTNSKNNDNKLKVDTSIPPIYDETTQQIIEKQQLQNNITDLQKMLAQSTASNAKANVDVESLKKQNAELTQQIAKMQIQNKKG